MAASLHMINNKPPLRISYPLHDYAHRQPSNYKQALAVQRSHEQRIIEQGILEDYNEEMNKAIEAGNFVKLSDTYMKNWKGGGYTMLSISL